MYYCVREAEWLACPPHALGCGFVSRPAHVKDHKNSTKGPGFLSLYIF